MKIRPTRLPSSEGGPSCDWRKFAVLCSSSIFAMVCWRVAGSCACRACSSIWERTARSFSSTAARLAASIGAPGAGSAAAGADCAGNSKFTLTMRVFMEVSMAKCQFSTDCWAARRSSTGPLSTRVSTTLPLAIDGGFQGDYALDALGARGIGILDAGAVHHGASGIHGDSGTVGHRLWSRGEREGCGNKPACQGQNSQPRGERRNGSRFRHLNLFHDGYDSLF